MIGEGLNKHVVVNYGQRENGTQYVFSKVGNAFKPEVILLENIKPQRLNTMN